jgi:hypothetical protein
VDGDEPSTQISFLDALEYQRMNEKNPTHPLAGFSLDLTIAGRLVRIILECNEDGATGLLVGEPGTRELLKITPGGNGLSVERLVFLEPERIRGTIAAIDDCGGGWFLVRVRVADDVVVPVCLPANVILPFVRDYDDVAGVAIETTPGRGLWALEPPRPAAATEVVQ